VSAQDTRTDLEVSVSPDMTDDVNDAAPEGAPARAAATSSRGRALVTGVLPPVVFFALFMGLWYLTSYVLLSDDTQFLVPAPHDIVTVSFLDPFNRAELFGGLWQTTVVAFAGLAVAIALGIGVAIAMSQARWVERAVFPYAVVLQSIPILAIVPLIGFALEYGFKARLLVCVLIALFPIITNTLFGLKSVDAGQQDLFTLHGATRWTRLTKLQLPAALPLVFTGLRISAGLSVVGAIVGDLFFKQAENPGIGSLIGLYLSRVEFQQMYAAILLSSGLGVAVFWFFGWLSQRVVGSWHVASGGDGR
jgi:NitT/TauT family transport system permease protein